MAEGARPGIFQGSIRIGVLPTLIRNSPGNCAPKGAHTPARSLTISQTPDIVRRAQERCTFGQSYSHLVLGRPLLPMHGFRGDIATGGGADGEGGAAPHPSLYQVSGPPKPPPPPPVSTWFEDTANPHPARPPARPGGGGSAWRYPHGPVSWDISQPRHMFEFEMLPGFEPQRCVRNGTRVLQGAQFAKNPWTRFCHQEGPETPRRAPV